MRKLILFATLLLLAGGAGAAEPSALTQSEDGVHFVNARFAVHVRKPDAWYAQNIEEQLLLQQHGKNIMAGEDNNLKAVLDAALANVVPIFSFFALPPGTPGKLNPNVISMAENIKLYPGITSGCDYLHMIERTLALGKVHYEFDGDCQKRKLGTTSFDYIDTRFVIGTITAHQRYFAAVKDGYALSLIETYFDADSERETEKVVAGFGTHGD